ncbi:MAG: hypothetical protein H6859_01035 [Rhodospirillales bacterium]|nr:hypothetical protein [Alphaproteobacteria bacterium]USO05818.1 MAG: hypothetical protein H6859_01035 [Rhodospirillales bacterium]
MSAELIFEQLYKNIVSNLHSPVRKTSVEERAANFINYTKINAKFYQKTSEQLLEELENSSADPATVKALKTHVQKLKASGKVSEDVARIFLGIIKNDSFKATTTLYNNAIAIPVKIPQDHIKMLGDAYLAAKQDVMRHIPSAEGSAHDFFNARQAHPTHSRIYISPKPEYAADAMRAWKDALFETGTQRDIYFKFTDEPRRYDKIVIYANSGTEEQIKKAVEAFQNKFPAEKLLTMPSTKAIAKGISYAHNPQSLNTLLGSLGYDKISYNQMITQLFQKSFGLSQWAAQKAGNNAPTPGELKPKAKQYFKEFVEVSGINPDTMIAKHTELKRKSWTSWLTKQSDKLAHAAKFVGKRIPVIGAFVTAAFTLAETGKHALKGDFEMAGAVLTTGLAETAGNVVGFGLGDAAREGTRKLFIEAAGEEFAEIEKSGLREIAEGAFELANNAYDTFTDPDESLPENPVENSGPKPPSMA